MQKPNHKEQRYKLTGVLAQLPHELLKHVISYLSVDSPMTLRRTCHFFNTVLFLKETVFKTLSDLNINYIPEHDLLLIGGFIFKNKKNITPPNVTISQVIIGIDYDHDGLDMDSIKKDSIYLLSNQGRVFACGGNRYGQFGSGDTKDKDIFTGITPDFMPGNTPGKTKIVKIKCGYGNTFLLSDQGRVLACGRNRYGQLGTGDTKNQVTFTDVTPAGTKIIKVVCGFDNTYLLSDQGRVWVCGSNDGQLSAGDTKDKVTFTDVTPVETKIIKVTLGLCAVFLPADQGQVFACGDNKYGQLGLGDTKYRAEFTQVKLFNGIKIIKVISDRGNAFSTATFLISDQGQVFASGSNYMGQLGTGDIKSKVIFTNVTPAGTKIIKVKRLRGSTFLISDQGQVFACGVNEDGQLGVGNIKNITEFTQVKLPKGIKISKAKFYIVYGKDFFASDNTIHQTSFISNRGLFTCGTNKNGKTVTPVFVLNPIKLYLSALSEAESTQPKSNCTVS